MGFSNILWLSINKKVKKFLYASSSSVYGDSKKFPLKESYDVKPKNIYGMTKKVNEEIAENISHLSKMQLLGLRFFTVYGEWGRPDMMLLKYINASYSKSNFYLNNYGKHKRDFTYIGDVVQIIEKLIKNKKHKKCDIVNICASRSIDLLKMIKFLNKKIKKVKIIKREIQKADVIKTYGSNKKLLKLIGRFKFVSIEKGITNTIDWFKQHNAKKFF